MSRSNNLDALVEQLTRRIAQVQRGFTDIRHAADELAASHSAVERQQVAEALDPSSLP
ncbi:MAG: hypothetical protein ABI835_17620 [Chloroflexota bacterium]